MSLTEQVDFDIDNLRKSLLSQKGEILNKSQEFKSEQANASSVSDEADSASLDILNSTSILLLEKDRKALFAIEKALGKIADGTYGCCEGCGEMISTRRLQARPFTALCIECQEEQEISGSVLQ